MSDLETVEVAILNGRGYSERRASTGFTKAVWWAGRKLATRDASPSETATQARVIASQACTPNSIQRRAT